MQVSAGAMRLALGFVVCLVVGLVYLLWTRSAPSEPTLAPGQSVKNPFGTAGMGRGPSSGGPTVAPPNVNGPTPSTGSPFSKEQFERMMGGGGR